MRVASVRCLRALREVGWHPRTTSIAAVVLAIVVGLAGTHEGAHAQHPAKALHACAPDGIALGGFDLLSYYSPGGPKLGKAEFALQYERLEYRFENDANRDRFRADPERYLPAYGGWCATTVAHGALRCPDYSNFRVERGRLLLFETTGFTNGRIVWESDPDGYRRRADESYRRLAEK